MRTSISQGRWPGLLAASLIFAAGLQPIRALGQEPAGDPATEVIPGPEPVPAVPAPSGIEAIEVTGERLDATNVQDEAQAVTAFDAGELERLQIGNVDGLSMNVPGLHVGQQGQSAIITLRGVGTENASLTGEPGVAFHVDDVYYGSPAAARTAFFDVESIEVKRGPQGFLGGKNSTSGAIWVNTRDPGTEYEVSGDWLMGNYDRQRGRGMVNIPLGEYFAARLAVFYEERDGYLDRQTVSYDIADELTRQPDLENPHFHDVSDDPFDLDNFGLRGKLRFMPTDAVDWVVGYNYFKEQGVGPQADFVALGEQPCQPGPAVPEGQTTQMGLISGCRAYPSYPDATFPPLNNITSFFPVTDDTDPRKIYTDFGSKQDDLYFGFSNKLQWDAPELPVLGETHLALLGGYQRNEIQFQWDFDATDQELSHLYVDNATNEYTAELQWGGGEILTWQTSFFFQRQTGDARVTSTGFERFPDPTTTQVPNFSTPGRYEATIDYDSIQWVQNKSYGAALHGTYAFTDSLSFSLGGRWNKDHKEAYLGVKNDTIGAYEACEPRGVGLAYGNRVGTKYPEPEGFSQDLPNHCGLKFRGTMWGSRLEWRPSDPFLLYAGIDRGYKAGGFASGGIGNYLPEKIWAYSAGAKSEFFDSRLQLNLEGFAYNYTDMQLALLDGTRIRTENTDAQMYGWELEMRAAPIEGLRLQGLFAYLHSETIDYSTLDPAALGFKGDPVALGLPADLSPTQLVNFQLNRVAFRDRNERLGLAWPLPGDECFSTPPPKRCTEVGTSGLKDGRDDYSGNQLSRSPEIKWNISGEYDIPLGRFGTLTPGIQYAWQDDAYYRVFNQDFDKQEAFHTTNLRLAWTSPEQRWDGEVFVNNVEDEAIKQNILIGPRGFGSPPLAWYSEPRFYGVRVGFRY
jgi:iron complex outermembrane receptor protein